MFGRDASVRSVADDAPRTLKERRPSRSDSSLTPNRAEVELGGEVWQVVDEGGAVAGQRRVEARRLGGGWRDALGPDARVDERSHAQTRRATARSARATASVSERLTHSSSSWAPAPDGPNMTVGIPAALMKAASAQ